MSKDIKDINNIEIGKKYYYFDNGVISMSHCFIVEITNKIPFAEIDVHIRKRWEIDKKECYWLYNDSTDYFIQADVIIQGSAILNQLESKQTIYFVRTKEQGWFSLGLWGGRLVDIEFYKENQDTPILFSL